VTRALLLGAIADDFTGATDAANTFVRQACARRSSSASRQPPRRRRWTRSLQRPRHRLPKRLMQINAEYRGGE
jgi:hypothetical protein